MSELDSIVANPWDESVGTCECCGQTTKTIWGDLSRSGEIVSIYYVQWTPGDPLHGPNIDLIVGSWGEHVGPDSRKLVSLLYQPGRDGGAFMVIDGAGRPADKRTVCGRAMKRAEVINTTLATDVFSFVDAIWLTEPRIAEINDLNDLV